MNRDKIKQLADEAVRYFTTTTRPNGDVIVVLMDTAPLWVEELCMNAHVYGQLPDDWTYTKLRDILEDLAKDGDYERVQNELSPDIYTNDLIKWVGSNPYRINRTDKQIKETLGASLIELIRYAQLDELIEILGVVLETFNEQLEKSS